MSNKEKFQYDSSDKAETLINKAVSMEKSKPSKETKLE